MIAFFDTVHEDTDLYSIPQVFRKLVPVKPLQSGQKAPLFGVHRQRTIGQYVTWQADYSKTVHLHDWLQTGPLVVAFYSAGWNGYGKKYLQKLIELQAHVQDAGANLLVVSPDSPESLQILVEQHDLPFTIVQDAENQIAGKFGVHSTDDPVWNWIAGITEDVPYPALFVVAPDRHIQFSYVDKDFDGQFPAEAVLRQIDGQSAVKTLPLYDRTAA
ncbi:redoxin domain-containing protein [Larkinella insperata]|uniref:thioredoxin-dependent peroxiredoxin n=1 Tax=Larkinella insperata TaxID=332158 RepID=A0ABW3QCH1_9BACT|nr:redoxin domain-containing protein [Larkinella insperata]